MTKRYAICKHFRMLAHFDSLADAIESAVSGLWGFNPVYIYDNVQNCFVGYYDIRMGEFINFDSMLGGSRK